MSEKEMPTQWYNIQADMPNACQPPLHPATRQPVGPDDLAPLFPMELIKQEVTRDRFVDIPEEVQDIYKIWRPSPLIRAINFEKALDAPVKIYYKNESVSPAGSHKPNTAVPQAYYNYKEGVKKLTTETGAGQWGSALSFACGFFGIELQVFMVKVSYNQKPYRKSMMNTWNANVVASPSTLTQAGRKILEMDPDSPGSLGIAISEAVEAAVTDPAAKYSLGSVLNHVLLHQTIIGEEAKKQLAIVGDYPDMIFAPCGGGSNFGGIAFPFFADKAAGREVKLVAVEPTSCPTLTKGVYAYDFGDAIGLTPLLKMYTLGHDFMPPGIHAGGLRYHGDSALVSQLHYEGLVDALAVPQLETFEAGVLFARSEGIVPAPESTHAIAAAVREAKRCAETGEPKTLLFNLSGHGHFDMSSYDRFFAGELQDYAYPEAAIQESLKHLPQVKFNPS